MFLQHYPTENHFYHDFRWLNNIQQLELDASENPSLLLDATIMASKNFPIIGEQVVIISVTQYVTTATVWPANNNLNLNFNF